MDVYSVNKDTLSKLYEQFPNAFKGMSLKDHCLVYNNKSIDLTTYNINNLLSGDCLFGSCLNQLSPDDVFDIIQLHVDFLGGTDNE